jgi:ATP-binding protein involved in chromosome partitioning
MGYSVGLLDCDIYGPSIPTLLGVQEKKPFMLNGKVQPIESFGLKVMSAGFLVEPGQSIIWRGPMVHKLIQQFIHDVDWGDLDILLIDLPPGTGDAPLSLAQTIPLTGAVMVSLPQKLSLIDVQKAVAMFHQVKVPLLGVIENMSYYVCSDCHKNEPIFDHGKVKKFCEDLGISFLGEIPIDPKLRELSDQGKPFLLDYSESPAGRSLTFIAKKLQPFLRTVEDSDKDQIKLVI